MIQYQILGYAYNYTGQLSVARTNGVALSVLDYILFAGGYTDTEGKNKSAVVDIYDTIHNIWSTTDMSEGRTLFAGASIEELAYFGCGETSSVQSETSSVDVWNASSKKWKQTYLSQPRKKCSAVSIILEMDDDGVVTKGKILFAGGWPKNGHTPTDVVDIFDYESNNRSTAKLSTARMYMSAASVGPYAVFAGGLSADGNSAVVDIYNALTNTWSTSKLISPQREGNGIGTIDNVIFYGSGFAQIFNPKTLIWTVRNLTAPWAKMAVATLDNGHFALFAGGIGCPGNVCDIIEIYDDLKGKWFIANKTLSVAREYLFGAGTTTVAAFAGGSNKTKNNVAVVDFITKLDF